MSDTDPTHSDLTDAVTRRPWLLALVTSAALFAFAITGVLFMHRSADDALELTLRDSLRSITVVAARSIDPVLHAQVRTAGDAASPAYLHRRARVNTQRVCPCPQCSGRDRVLCRC